MLTKVKHWQDGVNVILGLWMVISPWVLAYQAQTRPMWNSIVLGVLIAGVAVYALFQVFAWEEWANVVFGGWLVVSPWFLGFSDLFVVMLNTVIVGAIVAAMALWALGTDKDIGGWWSPVH
jgi:hypothetical protein